MVAIYNRLNKGGIEMPWDTTDYPSSLKNLDTVTRKKAIDIANAMLDEGYDEGRAIPIATSQAKEWYNNAAEKEINKVKQMRDDVLRARDDNAENSRPELMEKEEHVISYKDGWAVKTQNAKQAAAVYDKKEDAIKRAKEIAQNKGTSLIIHKQNGDIQEQINYSK